MTQQATGGWLTVFPTQIIVLQSIWGLMHFARDSRECALALLHISQESTKFKEQAAALAQMWLILAAIEDRLGVSVDQSIPTN